MVIDADARQRVHPGQAVALGLGIRGGGGEGGGRGRKSAVAPRHACERVSRRHWAWHAHAASRTQRAEAYNMQMLCNAVHWQILTGREARGGGGFEGAVVKTWGGGRALGVEEEAFEFDWASLTNIESRQGRSGTAKTQGSFAVGSMAALPPSFHINPSQLARLAAIACTCRGHA